MYMYKFLNNYCPGIETLAGGGGGRRSQPPPSSVWNPGVCMHACMYITVQYMYIVFTLYICSTCWPVEWCQLDRVARTRSSPGSPNRRKLFSCVTVLWQHTRACICVCFARNLLFVSHVNHDRVSLVMS